MKPSQVSGRAVYGIETRGKKNHSGFDPNPKAPPASRLGTSHRLLFGLKTEGSNTLLQEGVGSSEPCETLSSPPDTRCLDGGVLQQAPLLKCKKKALQLLTQQKPQKSRNLVLSPRHKSPPCPETSTHNTAVGGCTQI